MNWSPAARQQVGRNEVERARRLLHESMSERELQASVIELAQLQGWLTYHTFDSRRSAPGFPDVVAVRGFRLLAIELKSHRGQVTHDQRRWLNALAGAGTETYTWKPEEWTSGRIEEVLR